MGTFTDRLKGYANPQKGPHGAGRDQANIDYWSDRATENSKIAPRASDGPMRLTSTKQDVRDTGMRPYRSRSVDNVMKEAKADLDDVGSGPFMRGIRRNNP
jgi:hypothetical protein